MTASLMHDADADVVSPAPVVPTAMTLLSLLLMHARTGRCIMVWKERERERTKGNQYTVSRVMKERRGQKGGGRRRS